MMIINLKRRSSYIHNRGEMVERFFRDINGYKILTKEEEQELFKKIASSDKIESKKAFDKIINSNQRLIIAVAKRFADNNENNLLDLIDEGNIGLIEAIRRFNPNGGNRFISFAIYYIRREISAYCINNQTLVKKSNNQKLYFSINKIRNKFFQENERYPTEEEIKEIIKDDYNIPILNTVDVLDVKVDLIDEIESEKEDNFFKYNDLQRRLSIPSETEYGEFDEYNIELVQTLLSSLKPKERKVIELLYGINCDFPHDAAKISDMLGITRERVRQIKYKTLYKLKEKLKNKEIKL